jgi:ATP-dependent Clp protease, protease subunit
MSFPPDPAAFQADRLFDHRVVLAGGHLDGAAAAGLSAKLMLLAASSDEPIMLHLRTPDADLSAAFTVADTLGLVDCPVHVIAVGEVGGPALVVLAAAPRREMTRHAMLRLREPRGEYRGTAEEVATWQQQEATLVDAFYRRLADVTGREVAEIREDCHAGRLLTARDALGYGLVHDIAGAAVPPRF